MNHSTNYPLCSPRQQTSFRITQLIQVLYDPILETLGNSSIKLQRSVNTDMGTLRRWCASRQVQDAVRGARQEHIPIHRSLRPLVYKPCRHAPFERKENTQCSYR